MSVSELLPVAPTSSNSPTAEQSLLVAWRHPQLRSIEPVGVLTFSPAVHEYAFSYLRRAASVDGFRPFLAFRSLERRYVASELFPFFSQRVMDANRPDLPRYLSDLDLEPGASPMEILERSGGHRTGDSIQLFPFPTVEESGATSARFLVHGVRHQPGALAAIERLQPDDELRLVDEPTNPINAGAIQVATLAGQPIGWVPNFLLDYVRACQRAGGTRATVERANGPEAPMHLRVLARFEGQLGAQIPFTGPDWKSVA
jgi:hypothetical protein